MNAGFIEAPNFVSFYNVSSCKDLE
jgi:hypothetical protein